jgi:predicted DCC family thiol-disulfide oxidoreductase YuxK
MVARPPPRPLLIFDGDCHFCRHWIERWRVYTGDAVDYAPSQEVAPQFPEIPAIDFQNAVALVAPGGEVYSGAEAVYRSLAFGPRRWPLAFYQKNPVVAWISEVAYRFVSQHRELASSVTRLLWGGDMRPPSYFVARSIFLRALGLTYLVAFLSLWIQIDGLVGERGILPVSEFLPAVKAEYGTRAIFALPTLCWFNSSNAALHCLSAVGVIASLVLIVGWAPVIALITAFCAYLSLAIAGQTFLSFQWDILLLETGFLAIFFAPPRWRITRARNVGISAVALFLLKFLLFKLMFMSGVVKLTSGDGCWWNLTALDYHYWTQPLPTPIAWWADKHPEWFKKFSVVFCLLVEIIVPFFIWAPRRLRVGAAVLLVTLQIAIALTGNYCFFNLLTIVLCLLLIDDAVWRRGLSALQNTVFRDGDARAIVSPGLFSQLWRLAALAVLVVTLPLNLWLNYTAIRPEAAWPISLATVYSYLEPFRIVNGYGLFRVMTKQRPEIQMEGSADGIDWAVYDFKWKPDDVNRVPGWCAPHQPRLDWQMWFAALGGRRQEMWFGNFVLRLLQNEPAVTRLLAHNPFPEKPPRYIRGRLFQYEFTTQAEHRATGAWWKRREVGEYLPEVSLPP